MKQRHSHAESHTITIAHNYLITLLFKIIPPLHPSLSPLHLLFTPSEMMAIIIAMETAQQQALQQQPITGF